MSVHLEALYGLCNEHLAAERLGAMRLNSASFTEPVFGDLTIGKQPSGEWVRYSLGNQRSRPQHAFSG